MPIENADDGDMGDGNSCGREKGYDPEKSFDLESIFDQEKSFHREESHPEGANWSDDLSLLCRSFDSGSGEHADDPADDSIAEFIKKKKFMKGTLP
ncbi:hypothetical protein PCYB_126700 [Plasmodium cynomolgi strain B]|uniref:Uncharacterized protein n=1 Tax=Plasmodium cynomolgi (strain B) TaxID=1120755 RepID=K6UZK0_PLACD|nr:hypothetical protein PCYB_126700 [Plasmodium cynomolgi strain B]GAB68105.1 hypothetical protein PCYB_126700 [Plasmodium cynomolgi strain B]